MLPGLVKRGKLAASNLLDMLLITGNYYYYNSQLQQRARDGIRSKQDPQNKVRPQVMTI